MSYKKVTNPIARKMYNIGCDILLLPCKVNAFIVFDKNYRGFVQPVTISLKTCIHDANKFDRSVNDFEYYNCNSEMGYYSHYYVSEEDYNKYKGGQSDGIKESSET